MYLSGRRGGFVPHEALRIIGEAAAAGLGVRRFGMRGCL